MCVYCHQKQVFPQDLFLNIPEKEVSCELCGKAVHNTKFSLHVNDCERWPKFKKQKMELVVILTRLDKKYLKKYGIGIASGNEAKKLFQCKACQNQFVSKHTMRRHFKVVHLKERYNCDKCSKSFCDPRNLRDHVRSQHLGVFYQCPCGKQFNIDFTYKLHLKKCTLK